MITLPTEHTILNQRPGLGRIPAFDPKDQLHRMSAVAPTKITVTKKIWPIAFVNGQPLDQGQTSECTAYGGTNFLLAGPVVQPMYKTPHELYRLNQLNDEWPGTATEEPRYEGSSVHALMKVLKHVGLVGEYVWAFSADTVRRWVLTTSPVVVGTDWLSGMNDVDQYGYIHASGSPQGGHCYLIIGADDNLRNPRGGKGAFIILNSWGLWGYKNSGYAFISYKDMDGLIKRQGEAVTAVEVFNVSPLDLQGVIPVSSPECNH
jgi:hypothetical protein